MNRQRQVVYAERARVLDGADVKEQILEFIDTTVTGYVSSATAEGYPEDWDMDALWTALNTLYSVSYSVAEVVVLAGGSREDLSTEFLTQTLIDDITSSYQAREDELGDTVMRDLERRIILTVLDRKWREHLYEMDYLQEGIGLRAMAQRDPLVEYQREGYDLFVAMMEGIKEETVGFLFNVEVTVTEDDGEGVADQPMISAKGLETPKTPTQLQYTSPGETGEAVSLAKRTASDEYANVGRNDDCPCGSGKKFKKCHGAPGA
jgi:preprotein translocase subunit SecA